jgi:SAM-dependent methyltransferase
MSGSSYARRSKVETLLGKQIWDEVRGKVVVDFGCGPRAEAIELAQRGGRRIYGIDILERWLVIAREQAVKAACLCRWCTHIRNDGAQRLSEVARGLNRMTIRRFEIKGFATFDRTSLIGNSLDDTHGSITR